MSELFNEKLNLGILERICSGVGVEVNISQLAKSLGRHRHTVKEHVRELFEHKIIDRPIYPFMWLYTEYPLLVIVRADLPRNRKTDDFLNNDEHIFGAFYVRDEEYNTLLIEYHSDIYSYGEWRKRIVDDSKIPQRETRSPAQALFFSTKNVLKYQPYSPIYNMDDRYKRGQELEVNGYRMSTFSFQILKKLMLGEGIRTNEYVLARDLEVHRKTIERRIDALLRDNIIGKPVSRFPKFFVPPNEILVYSLIEVKKSRDKIMRSIGNDPCVPLALEANIGRYNLLLFGVFFNVDEHFRWEEKYEKNFPDCIGAMKNTYLTPEMTASIDQQKVSLGIIKQKKEALLGNIPA
jgi:DNA-binding Lrp family transcriptional regulator